MDATGLRPDAVRILFDQLMSVNPSVEVYLLDGTGAVVGDAAPSGHLRRERVAVEPIERLLRGEPLPMLGDDPRNAGRPKSLQRLAPGTRRTHLGVCIRDPHGRDARPARCRRRGKQRVEDDAVVDGARRFARSVRGADRVPSHHASARRPHGGDAPSSIWIALRRRHRRPVMKLRLAERDEIAILRNAFGRMAARIADQWRALTRQDQERRELIANVSHDLRTPLTSLHGFLETLATKARLERRRASAPSPETALAQSDQGEPPRAGTVRARSPRACRAGLNDGAVLARRPRSGRTCKSSRCSRPQNASG